MYPPETFAPESNMMMPALDRFCPAVLVPAKNAPTLPDAIDTKDQPNPGSAEKLNADCAAESAVLELPTAKTVVFPLVTFGRRFSMTFCMYSQPLTLAEPVAVPWSSASVPGAPSAPLPTDPDWSGGTLYVDMRERVTSATPDALWKIIEGIGGSLLYLVLFRPNQAFGSDLAVWVGVNALFGILIWRDVQKRRLEREGRRDHGDARTSVRPRVAFAGFVPWRRHRERLRRADRAEPEIVADREGAGVVEPCLGRFDRDGRFRIFVI